jgi:hypothetical protein
MNEQNEAFIVSLAFLQHSYQIIPKFGTRVNIWTAIHHLLMSVLLTDQTNLGSLGQDGW